MLFTSQLKKRTIFWSNGAISVLSGLSVGDCLDRAGYGPNSMYLIDFISNGEDHSWFWDGSQWVKKAIYNEKMDYAK